MATPPDPATDNEPDAFEPIRQMRHTVPPGGTEIILVRHGESEPFDPAHPFPLVDGHGDPALAPEGREQAERVADALADEPLSAIWVTTLRRTAETAAPLARRLGLEPRVEPDLREVFLGDWEGGLFRLKMREGTDPAVTAFLNSDAEWGEIPNAETVAQLGERTERGLRRVAAQHPDELVACVVHGGVIGSLLSRATGGSHRTFGFAENCSFQRVVVTPEQISMRSFNEVAHLR